METASGNGLLFKHKFEDYIVIAAKVDIVIIQELADRLSAGHS